MTPREFIHKVRLIVLGRVIQYELSIFGRRCVGCVTTLDGIVLAHPPSAFTWLSTAVNDPVCRDIFWVTVRRIRSHSLYSFHSPVANNNSKLARNHFCSCSIFSEAKDEVFVHLLLSCAIFFYNG